MVSFEINQVTSWQIAEDSTSETIRNLDASKLHPLARPVQVEGAEPGDAPNWLAGTMLPLDVFH